MLIVKDSQNNMESPRLSQNVLVLNKNTIEMQLFFFFLPFLGFFSPSVSYVPVLCERNNTVIHIKILSLVTVVSVSVSINILNKS